MQLLRRVLAALIVVAGLGLGAFAGIRYYDRSYGDWRIGATAVGIGLGITAAAAVVALVVLWVLSLLPRDPFLDAPPFSLHEGAPAPEPRRDDDPVLLHRAPQPAGLRPGERNSSFEQFIDIAAGLASVGAGLYLLQYQSSAGTSWFEIIGHGMGVYFIAKGVFIWRSARIQAASRDHLARLVELAKTDRSNEDVR